MDRLSRESLNTELKRFGVDVSDRMFQHAQRAIGITPEYEGVAQGKGKVSRFDPIDGWVFATAAFGRGGAWTSGAVRLDQMAEAYETALALSDARSIAPFADDKKLGMKLLYICRLDGGFPLPRLHECLMRDPNLYELSRFESVFLQIWLKSYVRAYGETWSSVQLPVPETRDASEPLDMRRLEQEHFARIIEWAGALFRDLGRPEFWQVDEGDDA